MTSMGFAQSTQSDQIKGKIDDSRQFFVEYLGAKLFRIVSSRELTPYMYFRRNSTSFVNKVAVICIVMF